MVNVDYYYNITGLGGQKTIVDAASHINTHIFGGWLGAGILLIVFGVSFFVLRGKTQYASDSFAASGVIVMLLALIMRPLGWVDDWSWYTAITLGLLGILVLWLSRKLDN